MKGDAKMTVKELKKKLKEIPSTGAINRARRREIIALIDRLQGGGTV